MRREIQNGAAEGTRTPDPIITNDVLYHLSYSGPVAPKSHGCAALLALYLQSGKRLFAVFSRRVDTLASHHFFSKTILPDQFSLGDFLARLRLLCCPDDQWQHVNPGRA